MSGRKMEKVVCHNDNFEMQHLFQFQSGGRTVHRFQCRRCGGKADLAPVQGGKWAPVQLSGTDNDFRPQTIKRGQSIKIEAAYTLGVPSGGTKRVPAVPIQIQPAYQTGPLTPRPPNRNHPMHPANIRRRTAPRRLK